MELKYRNANRTISQFASFNRTFMELKYEPTTPEEQRQAVLIVPLWN